MLQGLGLCSRGPQQGLHVLATADVMQTFSTRPEVQFRAINKLLTIPEEELGKGLAPSPGFLGMEMGG